MDDFVAAREEKLQTLKVILDTSDELEEKQKKLNADLSATLESLKTAAEDAKAELTSRKSALQKALRDTFPLERDLSAKKHDARIALMLADEALSAYVRKVEGEELWKAHEQRRHRAIDSLSTAFGMKPLTGEATLQKKKEAIIDFLRIENNTALPMYLKNGRLRERQEWAYDNCIVSDAEITLDGDPVEAFRSFGTVTKMSDVAAANDLLAHIREAWAAFEEAEKLES